MDARRSSMDHVSEMSPRNKARFTAACTSLDPLTHEAALSPGWPSMW